MGNTECCGQTCNLAQFEHTTEFISEREPMQKLKYKDTSMLTSLSLF